MGEIVDTNAFPLFPTGKREFYIENVRKRQAKNDPSIKFYSWKLSTSIDGDTMTKDILIVAVMIIYLTAFSFGLIYCLIQFLQFLHNYGG